MQPSVQTAIDILVKLQKELGPSSLAYWVTPNTVLTLSGARAYCDGVFYNKDRAVLKEWAKEITDSIEIIKSTTDVYFASTKLDKTSIKEAYATYDVIMSTGLKYVFAETKLLGSGKNDLLSQKLQGEKLVEATHNLLRNNPALKRFNDENLRHVAFGILVGYPDAAILGSVTEWEKDDPFAEPLIDADIRGSWYYICPRPVYSYPRHLVTDSVINTHEHLWSGILKDYYTSGFHSKLEKDPKFQKKAEVLGLNR